MPVIAVAAACQVTLMGSATAATTAATATSATAGSVVPNSINELDCNGWSARYDAVRQLGGDLCTDPIRVVNGHASRFIDNGWYVGHDEPSIKFISGARNSGNTMTYLTQLPVDPSRSPTSSGSVTNYGQLSVAPWFGLPICDPNSYPQNPCTPDSDSNTGVNSPTDAGSAFMELQLYPPGYTPFVDSESCSATQWCAAMTIDSLECNYGFATCNPNCIEPVNFAYLQTNGVPAGPPSPQLSDASTLTPDGHTLKINPGDVLVVSITDPPQGFTTTIRDLTTHQTGFMTASASNGFMNTSLSTCNGTPFTFHAEYNTASIQNRVPWAALEGGVLMEQEIGHSEVCKSLTNQDPVSIGFGDGQSFADQSVYDTCVGGSEGKHQVGEGPCNASFICQNAETQGPSGPQACPTDNALSGALCEFADGYCFQKGIRTVVVNGVAEQAQSDSTQCFDNRFQNGDLDFDGLDYTSSAWPDGSQNHPTTFQYLGPFDAHGKPYPQIQFESDIGGSSNLCNTATGAGCTVPPISAQFYPFWSLGHGFAAFGYNGFAAHGSHGYSPACIWNFGNVVPGTRQDFGKDVQYGSPDLSWYGGTIISSPMANPQFSGRCARRSYS